MWKGSILNENMINASIICESEKTMQAWGLEVSLQITEFCFSDISLCPDLLTWGAWKRLFSGFEAELLFRDWEIRHLYRSEWTRSGLYELENWICEKKKNTYCFHVLFLVSRLQPKLRKNQIGSTWSRHEATTDSALSLVPSTGDWTSLGSIISLTAIDFSNRELSDGRRRKCPWGEALEACWRLCETTLWPLVLTNSDTPLIK